MNGVPVFSMFANSKLIEIKNLPQSSVGAPLPSLLSSERNLFLLYYLQNTPNNWDGKTVQMVDMTTIGKSVGIIKFAPFSAYKFGPPSDEAISGHPLYKSGLKPYSFFEVEKSEWIASLEKMNSVHPHHKKERFQTLRHYIFTFHDSTFECVARSYESEIKSGPMSEVYKAYADRIVSE